MRRARANVLAAVVAVAAASWGCAGPAGAGSPPASNIPPAAGRIHSSPGRTTPIRVVTYNIHAGKDARGMRNLEAVAALLDTLAADVVLLQEVDRGTERSGREDQLAVLERLAGMKGAFGRSLDYQGGAYGIAVLSRWPIERSAVVPLTVEPPQERAGGSYEARVALHVVVRAPDGPLHVLNTHLDPAGTATYRRQELVGLMAHAARAVPGDAALVVGGDLNTRPPTDEIAALGLALTDAWARCGTGGGETFPATAPDRRIDYIFVRGAECTEARVWPTLASDHLPLLVVLERP